MFSAFAAGYFLSYTYRTVNAVISPELSRDLALADASLGFVTSAYFLAFGVMQIPIGMLLDRFGPRRVEPGDLFLIGHYEIVAHLTGEAAVALERRDEQAAVERFRDEPAAELAAGAEDEELHGCIVPAASSGNALRPMAGTASGAPARGV